MRKFESVKQLEELTDKYFKECDDNKEPYTITGLALFLDTSRETLLNYEKNNPNLKDYFDTIKRAKLKCHNYAEKRLFEGQCVGAIFNLKNNYGWKDKTEHEITPDSKLEISWQK